MDLRQLEYILTIYEEQNITRAAERLFITQSALNQQLLKLERELGSPLFVRSRSDWRLTKVGEIYIDGARRIMQIKKETYHKISDYASLQNTMLRIGIITDRGRQMFVEIYPRFNAMHPEVQVEARELIVRDQFEKLRKGTLDLGYVTMDNLPQDCVGELVLRETLLLAVPADHPIARENRCSPHHCPSIELIRLRNETFSLFSKFRTIRDTIDGVFENAGFKPIVLSHMDSALGLLQMVSKGICCTIVPESYFHVNPNIAWFEIDPRPNWTMFAVRMKSSYYSKAARDFVELSKEYWAGKNDRNDMEGGAGAGSGGPD